jgi:hypothetical protein
MTTIQQLDLDPYCLTQEQISDDRACKDVKGLKKKDFYKHYFYKIELPSKISDRIHLSDELSVEWIYEPPAGDIDLIIPDNAVGKRFWIVEIPVLDYICFARFDRSPDTGLFTVSYLHAGFNYEDRNEQGRLVRSNFDLNFVSILVGMMTVPPYNGYVLK